MKCTQLKSRFMFLRFLHRLQCQTCRTARRADQTFNLGMESLKSEPIVTLGMSSTLELFGAKTTVQLPQRKRRLVTKRTFAIAGVFLSLYLGYCNLFAYLDREPVIPYRHTPQPVPNAYVTLQDTARLLPDNSNGYFKMHWPAYQTDLYSAVENLERPNEIPDSQGNKTTFYAPPSLEDKRNLLKAHQKALASIRKALNEPYVALDYEGNSYVPNTEAYFLAQLLRLEAQVKLTDRDYYGVVNIGLDIMELGALLTHRKLNYNEQAVQIQGIGRDFVWDYADKLNADQTKEAINRLEKIMAKEAPISEVLQKEKYAILWSLRIGLHRISWRWEYAYQNTRSFPSSQDATYLQKFLVAFFQPKQSIVDGYLTALDTIINQADAIDKGQQNPKEFLRHRPSIPFHHISVDSSSRIQYEYYRAQLFHRVAGLTTQNRLLLAHLGLHAYYKENNNYPKTLQELVPKYLASVPTDPFNPGKTVRYHYYPYYSNAAVLRNGIVQNRPYVIRLHGQTILPLNKPISVDGGQRWFHRLYSVGPDAKENNGSFLKSDTIRETPYMYERFSFEKGKNFHILITPGSEGDILAGVNRKVDPTSIHRF